MKTSGFGDCHLVGAKMECSKAGPFRGGHSLLGLPLSIAQAILAQAILAQAILAQGS